jgi:hypothetical protein
LASGAADIAACDRTFGSSGCAPSAGAQIVIDPASTFPFAPDPRPSLTFRSATCGTPADACQVDAVQMTLSEHVNPPPGGFESVLGLQVFSPWSMLPAGTTRALVPSTRSIPNLVEPGTDLVGTFGQFTPTPTALFFQNGNDPKQKNPVTSGSVTPLAIVHTSDTGGYVAAAFEIHFTDGTWLRGALTAPWEIDLTECPVH